MCFGNRTGYKKISGDFLQYITKLLDGPQRGMFQCIICSKISGQKIHAQNHVEGGPRLILKFELAQLVF